MKITSYNKEIMPKKHESFSRTRRKALPPIMFDDLFPDTPDYKTPKRKQR